MISDKDMEEIIILNLKINSLILTTLSNMNNFPISKNSVLILLEDIKSVLIKIEKSK
jgi:hypothetical protein